MDVLPNEVLDSVLARLPVVDSFRFRRVSHRFCQSLQNHPKHSFLDIDQIELGVQLRQRRLTGVVPNFYDILHGVVTHYGDVIVELRVKFANVIASKAERLVYKIAKFCPNLLRLQFSRVDGSLVDIPLLGFLEMPRLKHLRAKLVIDNTATTDQVDSALHRIVGMSEVTCVRMTSGQNWLANCNLSSISAVKQLEIDYCGAEVGNVSVSSEGLVKLIELESFRVLELCEFSTVQVLPKMLTKLDLGDVKFVLQQTHLNGLAKFSNLVGFHVDCWQTPEAFPDFQFLENYGCLEILSIKWSSTFYPDHLLKLSSKSHLRNVCFEGCQEVDDDIFEILNQRGCQLESINLSNCPVANFENCLYNFISQHSASLHSIELNHLDIDDQLFHYFFDHLIDRLRLLSVFLTDVTGKGIEHFVNRRIDRESLKPHFSLHSPKRVLARLGVDFDVCQRAGCGGDSFAVNSYICHYCYMETHEQLLMDASVVLFDVHGRHWFG